MVFNINFGDRCGHVMFEIEYYKKMSEYKKGEFHSEVHVSTFANGILRFYESKKDDKNFNLNEFINDTYNIEELRMWLYEVEGNKNVEDHYGSRWTYIKNTVYDFADKYGLYVNID